MNGLGKPIRKKIRLKKWKKTAKTKVKLPHENKKAQARKRTFIQTPFSHPLKKRWKKFYITKLLAFSLHFLFRRDQNHYFNLTSKIMNMCEDLKKKTAPQYNSNSLKFKKTKSTAI